MAALRGLRQMFCVLPFMALAACSGIEEGDKIAYIEMVNKSTTTPVVLPTNAVVQSYLCLRQQLGIIAVFNKNGSADYSTRPGAIWTSTNESVAHVSNGDDIVPSTDPTAAVLYYPKGVITPKSPGVTTISVNYAGIVTSVTLQVQNPGSIILTTSPYYDASSNASTAPPFSMAAGSTQQFSAYALLPNADGQANVTALQNVTGSAKWTFLEDANGSFATITNPTPGTTVGGGLVTAVSPSGNLTVNAHFSACEGTSYDQIDITAKVKVARITSLKVLHDPNFINLAAPNPVGPLVVGTNEALQAIATLDNGDTQDLSYQALFSTTTGNTGILGFLGNIAQAAALGVTNVTASFTSAGNTITSQPAQSLTIQTQNATLNTLKIASGDINKSIPAQGFYQYHAVGSFVPSAGGSSFLQDMTHTSVWATSNSAIVNIGNSGQIFGLAYSQTSAQNCVNVGVTSVTQNPDGSKTDSTILGVAGVVTSGCQH